MLFPDNFYQTLYLYPSPLNLNRIPTMLQVKKDNPRCCFSPPESSFFVARAPRVGGGGGVVLEARIVHNGDGRARVRELDCKVFVFSEARRQEALQVAPVIQRGARQARGNCTLFFHSRRAPP
jgi:hypothetical protein